jgi:hypothetical protein
MPPETAALFSVNDGRSEGGATKKITGRRLD